MPIPVYVNLLAFKIVRKNATQTTGKGKLKGAPFPAITA
jgi:hypothetical protein